MADFGYRRSLNLLCEARPTDGACVQQVTADQMGRSFPLRSTIVAGDVNFSGFSRQARRVELFLLEIALS